MGDPITSTLMSGTGLRLVGSGLQAYDAYQQGQDEQAALRENARRAQLEAQDALARGAEQAALARMKGSRVIAAQKTAIGASGVDAGVGSAVQLMADSRIQSEMDALTIRNNAIREAYGMRSQALGLEKAGRRAATAANRRAAASILGGVAGAADSVKGFLPLPG